MGTEDLLNISLEYNASKIKDLFHYPLNSDLTIRDLYLKAIKKNSALFYIDGIVNEEFIDGFIIKPLVQNTEKSSEGNIGINSIKNTIQLSNNKIQSNFSEVVKDLLDGRAILIIDGYAGALSLGTLKYEHRSIERSESENVTKGSHEAFVESAVVNRSLIRKYLKNKNLISEAIDIGVEDKCDVHIMYNNAIANSNLVEEVRSRINKIKEINYNGMITTSILEQFIEDNQFSIVPTILFTELPDRAVSFIKEGHVVILVDNNPSCLIVPATFWSFFHTPEDMSYRWIPGNFIRLIRLIAVLISLLTPALYIAVTNYHQEMIPTDLLLAISASREKVPFPIVFEVVGMEIAFEIIRECSFRIPTSIGSTIGIVGTLILGQAAVQANIISPTLVIVVAITGLSTFAVSNTDLNMSIRISRFFFTFCSIMMGFLGLSIGITVFMVYIISISSFGVPFLAPIVPHYDSSKDMIFRSTVKEQWLKALFTNPKIKYKKTPSGEE